MELPAPCRAIWPNRPSKAHPFGVWRDWVLLAVVSTTAVLELLLRNDDEWLLVSRGWHWASLVSFFVAVVPAILFRRTRPLLVAACGFAITISFGVIVARLEGEFGGLWSTAIILITLYTVFRWGSGRDGLLGLVLAVIAGIAGNLADPTTGLSDWIGGFIVLSIRSKSVLSSAISAVPENERSLMPSPSNGPSWHASCTTPSPIMCRPLRCRRRLGERWPPPIPNEHWVCSR